MYYINIGLKRIYSALSCGNIFYYQDKSLKIFLREKNRRRNRKHLSILISETTNIDLHFKYSNTCMWDGVTKEVMIYLE